MKITKDIKLCISIIVTGRCNCSCEYCHFYASHPRSEYNRDIDLNLFERYMDYINYLQTITKNISIRFSGGEPLFMGDYLWKLTNECYNKTGIKPYIMTNGKLLCKDTAQLAKKNNVRAFVVSIENPFEKIKGTEETSITLKKIEDCKDIDIPILFGMMIIKNECYKDIYKIANYFYEKVNMIPPMCEVNYLPYKSATSKELKDLYENVKRMVCKYNGLCDISLFPYVIPEYYSNNLQNFEYLTEFPIDDKHNMLKLKNDELVLKTEEQINKSYTRFECKNKKCDWHDECKYIKWVWNMETPLISKDKKNDDYCKLKKTLSSAFYDALCGDDKDGL